MLRAYRAIIFLPALLLPPALTRALSAAQASTAQATPATAPPAWESNLATRRQQLVDSNGAGTDTALRQELLAMHDQDQAARGFHPGAPAATHTPGIAGNLTEIDAALTAHLKTIVQQHGWPTIALVGLDASNAAMLLLTHTADHAWQRELLPQLETLADQRKIDGATLALVIDKELVAGGKPQRYGTQFKFVDGTMAMIQVEDPGGLDSLRARTLLPPIEVYKAQLARLYHLKPSNRIVSPGPPPSTPATP